MTETPRPTAELQAAAILCRRWPTATEGTVRRYTQLSTPNRKSRSEWFVFDGIAWRPATSNDPMP